MKEQIEKIRSLLEQVADNSSDADESIEIIFEELDKLEPIAEHLDNCDDYDIESWTVELRQLLEDIDE